MKFNKLRITNHRSTNPQSARNKFRYSNQQSTIRNRNGFTLIELMVSISILVIIGGTAYTVFDQSIDIYHSQMNEMLVSQKCRAALNQLVLDLSSLYAIEGDDDFMLLAQDNPLEEDVSQDMLTFVILRDTRPDQFLTQLNAENEQVETTEEETQNLKSDLMRVLYMVGPDPNEEETEFEDEEEQTIYLLRMVMSQLNLEESEAESAMEGEVSSAEEIEDDTEITPFIDDVKSLDFRYFDGEDWYDTWEEEGDFPKSIQITITVTDESGDVEVTQSTQVYLRMTANFEAQSEMQAAGQSGGGQSGGGGMPPGQM